LPPLQYERERQSALEKLGISRLSILDKLVDAKRHEGKAAATAGQGRCVEIPDVEPWPNPVHGACRIAALLDELAQATRRHVVLDTVAADAATLWIVHTYAIDIAYISPRLAITSPEKRCGKTTLLTVVGALVARPQPAANMTTATLFRVIDAARPTLLVD
jgi:hypothetical protein